jgi:ribosomal protein L37E
VTYRTPPDRDPSAQHIFCVQCGSHVWLVPAVSCRTCGVAWKLEDQAGLAHYTRSKRCACPHTGGSDDAFYRLLRLIEGKPEPHEVSGLPMRAAARPTGATDL